MGEYLCNLVVPGFPKSGTSSLHDFLDQHSDVCMSSPKESHYFAVTRQWELGVDFHNSLFSHCKRQPQYYGESSTIYCICQETAKRISEQLHKPKIILLLRDPVQRLISHYNWLYKLGLETRPILEAVESNGDNFHPDKPIPGSGNYMAYVTFSAYSVYVPMWTSVFGEGNVKLVFTNQLAESPLQTVNECFEFLGLSALSAIRDKRENKTSDARHMIRRKWAAGIEASIPQSLVNFAAKNERLKRIWQQFANEEVSIDPPGVTEREIAQITKRLQREIDYFKSLSSITKA